MKTICPHCKQEYPETPDEYLGMTLQCSVCEKEFECKSQAIKLHKIDDDISGWAIGGYIAFLVAMFIGLSGILSPLALFLGIMAIRKGDKFNGWLCALAGGISSFMLAVTVMGAELKVIYFIKSLPAVIPALIKGIGFWAFYIFIFLSFAAIVGLSSFILFKLVRVVRNVVNMKKISMYINLLLSFIAVIVLICDLCASDFWGFMPDEWATFDKDLCIDLLRILCVYTSVMGICNAWAISKALNYFKTSDTVEIELTRPIYGKKSQRSLLAVVKEGIKNMSDIFLCLWPLHKFNLNAYGVLCSLGITFLPFRLIIMSFDNNNTPMWVGIPILLAFIPVPFAIFCLLLDRELGWKEYGNSSEQINNEE